MTKIISQSLLDQFHKYVTAHLGLEFTASRISDLERGGRAAAHDSGFNNFELFVNSILSNDHPTSVMLELLAEHLVVGETYFFRDARLFLTLEEQIFPAIIKARQNGIHRLYIWSAACCTGEEAYSLAIVIDRLFHKPHDWDIKILATDINQKFLKKAKTGIYSDWSFRSTPTSMKARYFRKVSDGKWEINTSIRRMVQFKNLNLLNIPTSTSTMTISNMDIILCRNALMYFSVAQAGKVFTGLLSTLARDGYLVMGPSEGVNISSNGFIMTNRDGIRLYQKHKPIKPPDSILDNTNCVSGSDDEPFATFAAKPTCPLMPEPPEVTSLDSCHELSPTTKLMQQARDYAGAGNLAKALSICDEIILKDKLNTTTYYLKAMILQENSDFSCAKLALQKAIYLDPELVLAHFALGNLAFSQGNLFEARKNFRNALVICLKFSPDEILPESEGLSAQRLVEIIRIVQRSLETNT